MKKILLVIILSLITTAFTACADPTESILNAVERGQYSEAWEVYDTRINEKSREKLITVFVEVAQKAYDDYNDGIINYELAYSQIQRIILFDCIESYSVYDIAENLERLHISKEHYVLAEQYMIVGEYIKAIDEYQGVMHFDKNFFEVTDKIKEAREKYIVSILDKATAFVTEHGDFYAAFNTLQAAEISDDRISNEQHKYFTEWESNIIARAEEAYNTNDYSTAIDILLEMPWTTDRTKILIDQYSYEWEQSVIEEAKTAFSDNKDYNSAIKVLQNSGIDSDVINQRIDYYLTYVPKYLTTLKPTEEKYVAEGCYYGDESTDVNNKKYNTDYIIRPYGSFSWSDYADSDDEGYITYYLNKEYSTLSATLYRTYATLSMSYDTKPVVKIYGDGALLYTAPTIDKNTYDPIKIKVDITGVRELKIVIRGTVVEDGGFPGIYSRNSAIALADVTVQK